jgi:hypothetical protein
MFDWRGQIIDAADLGASFSSRILGNPDPVVTPRWNAGNLSIINNMK